LVYRSVDRELLNLRKLQEDRREYQRREQVLYDFQRFSCYDDRMEGEQVNRGDGKF